MGPGVKAMGAAGTPVQLRVASETPLYVIPGELLTVSPEGILLLRSDTKRVTEVRYPFILDLEFKNTGIRLKKGQRPTPAELDVVRPYARYPQGLSPDLLRRLLEAYGQQEPDQLGSDPTTAAPLTIF
jgi:hypothetical protein